MAAVKQTDAERARERRDVANRAAAEAEQKYGRASHVTRWGSDDPREEASAHDNVHRLKVALLDARAAAEQANREFIAASHEEAAGRAPAWRERHQDLAAELHSHLARVVELHDALERSGAEARQECCVNGNWVDPCAYSNDIIALAAHVKPMLPGWQQRMKRGGWLK